MKTQNLIIAFAFLMSLQFSFAKVPTIVDNSTAIVLQENGLTNLGLESLSLDQIVTLTPKSVASITGKKISFKEVVALKTLQNKLKKAGGPKKQLVAFLLCFFLGGMGIHRFYLGYTWQGIVQLLTGGGCGIWVLIDFIRIILNKLPAKGGAELESW